MTQKLHVGDPVLYTGTIRRYTIKRLADYEKVRERIHVPIELPAEDPVGRYVFIGVVAVIDLYPQGKEGVILGWTHIMTGRYIKGETGGRALVCTQRTEVLAVQPWDKLGKFRRPVFCLLSHLEW
jgi:hypothetical protein